MWTETFNPKINFIFKEEVSPDSPYWGLVNYFQSVKKDVVRTMLIEAARTFWEPLITYEFLEDQEKARYQATLSIYKLQNQYQEVQNRFKLKSLPDKPIISPEIHGDKPLKFEFRYQVKTESITGRLVQYFHNEETLFNEREKVLKPSLAYWGAIAWQKLNVLSASQLKNVAAYCLYQLQNHLDFLGRCFCLNEFPNNHWLEAPFNTNYLSPVK